MPWADFNPLLHTLIKNANFENLTTVHNSSPVNILLIFGIKEKKKKKTKDMLSCYHIHHLLFYINRFLFPFTKTNTQKNTITFTKYLAKNLIRKFGISSNTKTHLFFIIHRIFSCGL